MIPASYPEEHLPAFVLECLQSVRSIRPIGFDRLVELVEESHGLGPVRQRVIVDERHSVVLEQLIEDRRSNSRTIHSPEYHRFVRQEATLLADRPSARCFTQVISSPAQISLGQRGTVSRREKLYRCISRACRVDVLQHHARIVCPVESG